MQGFFGVPLLTLTCTLRTARTSCGRAYGPRQWSAPCVVRERQRIHASPNDETHACVHRHQRYFKWLVRISNPLEPASSRNGSRWFAAYDQAEKNRPVKNALLEKEHDWRSLLLFRMFWWSSDRKLSLSCRRTGAAMSIQAQNAAQVRQRSDGEKYKRRFYEKSNREVQAFRKSPNMIREGSWPLCRQ